MGASDPSEAAQSYEYQAAVFGGEQVRERLRAPVFVTQQCIEACQLSGLKQISRYLWVVP